MESCKSDSLQSSSGGEDEYDSRAAFMSCGGSINPANSIPPLTPLFDPNPIVSNYPTFNNIISPHTKPINNPLITDGSINNTNSTTANNTTNPYTTGLHHPPPANAPPPQTAARNPKKRSRASRRAPTTVLTTDTTNFRAMVQEFTGIPSPPFVNSSPFTSRNRLDHFASSFDSTPSYLRRPFAQKFQSPVFPFLENPLNNTTSSSTSQSSNLFSNVDQGFFLRSASNSQANHQNKGDNVFSLGSKAGAVSGHDHSFGVSNSSNTDHQHLHRHFGLNNITATFDSGLANLISTSTINGDTINAATWNESIVRRDHEDGLRSNNKKFNFSGPSASNLNGEKRPENSGREGIVETWICSSSD